MVANVFNPSTREIGAGGSCSALLFLVWSQQPKCLLITWDVDSTTEGPKILNSSNWDDFKYVSAFGSEHEWPLWGPEVGVRPRARVPSVAKELGVVAGNWSGDPLEGQEVLLTSEPHLWSSFNLTLDNVNIQQVATLQGNASLQSPRDSISEAEGRAQDTYSTVVFLLGFASLVHPRAPHSQKNDLTKCTSHKYLLNKSIVFGSLRRKARRKSSRSRVERWQKAKWDTWKGLKKAKPWRLWPKWQLRRPWRSFGDAFHTMLPTLKVLNHRIWQNSEQVFVSISFTVTRNTELTVANSEREERSILKHTSTLNTRLRSLKAWQL